MIIFLYGEDSYRINQKIKEIVKGYEAKNPSGFNLAEIDLEESKIDDFFETARAGSLIPEKKLIILKNIFSADSEKILEFFQPKQAPLADKFQDIIFLIIHFGGSNKDKLFEYLTAKPNQSQNFKILKEYEIKSWARQFANSLDIDFASDAIDFLVANRGADLWRLDSEIRKLADYKVKGILSKSQVEELTAAGADYKVFELTDAMARKDKKKALAALYKTLDGGEKPTEMLGLLAWQIRNLLRFKMNPNNPAELKLHPFVLEKTKTAAKLFSIEELKTILSRIIDLDLTLKTSDSDAKTALSLLIAEL